MNEQQPWQDPQSLNPPPEAWARPSSWAAPQAPAPGSTPQGAQGYWGPPLTGGFPPAPPTPLPQQGGQELPPPTSPPKAKSPWTIFVPALLLAAFLGGTVGGVVTSRLYTPPVHILPSAQETTTWNTIVQEVTPSVVTLEAKGESGSGSGSGVVLDTQGHIITNHHVVAMGAGTSLRVIQGQESYQAVLVGTDPTTDLAVVKLVELPPEGLTPMRFGDSQAVQVGDEVMALGSPLGLNNTATTGIISALDRPVVTTDGRDSGGMAVVTNALQTSAPINPGNSGGALVNSRGELIGINSSIATVEGSKGSSGNIGIGFAIPTQQVKTVVEELLRRGTVEHAYLGVTVSDNMLLQGGSEAVGRLGVQLRSVGEGSPAWKAGLRVGDTLLAYNDRPLLKQEGLVAAVRMSRPGETITLQVVTFDGVEKKVEVTLGIAPK